MVNKEIKFVFKVVRNGVILAGLYFLSVWASGDVNFEMCKPIIIFLGTYCLTELTKRYGIDRKQSINKKKRSVTTLLF